MDQDSCHRLLHACGYHTDPNLGPHSFLSVPRQTPAWSPDSAGALAAGLHICPLSAGAGAAAPHHAAVLHVQPNLQAWSRISQEQEEELTQSHVLVSADIFLHFRMSVCDACDRLRSDTVINGSFTDLYVGFLLLYFQENVCELYETSLFILKNEHFHNVSIIKVV